MDASRRPSCSTEALVLALCIPLLCLHERYNPDVSVPVGSTSVEHRPVGYRHVDHPRRPRHATAVASASSLFDEAAGRSPRAATLIALVFLGTLGGPILTEGYPIARSLVSAAKFAEYGVARGRRAADRQASRGRLCRGRRVDGRRCSWPRSSAPCRSSACSGNLDNVPAGRRMPSFVGLPRLRCTRRRDARDMHRGDRLGHMASRCAPSRRVAAVAGVIGVVIAGAMATVLALMLGGVLSFVYMVVAADDLASPGAGDRRPAPRGHRWIAVAPER